MRQKRILAVLVLVLFVLSGCAGKMATTSSAPATQAPASEAAMAFDAINKAFVGYDFGMTTLRQLQQTKVITQAQFDLIKAKVTWPFYNAIVAADSAANAYATAPIGSKQSAQGKLTQALAAMVASQKEFTELVNSLKGKGVK